MGFFEWSDTATFAPLKKSHKINKKMIYTNLVTEARALVDATSTSYPDALLLIRINNAYEEIVGNLIAKNGSWEFDDTNYTTFPIGKATLVADQQDYAFDTTHLVIERVQVLDKDGIWHLLNPIDRKQIHIPMEEYMKESGLPVEYDKSGSSILLYPKPKSTEVTLADGLRVYFQRTASLFIISDTTKTPGFASPYHVLLAYKAALPYAMSYKKDRVAGIMTEIARLEKKLYEFENNKEKDVRHVVTMRGIQAH